MGGFLLRRDKMSALDQILNFYKIIEKLSLVKRDIKLSDGQYENDTSHILKLMYMTQIVVPYLQTRVNKTKLLELALVHDLAEAQCGDVPLCQQSRNAQYKKTKQQNELNAIMQFRDMLPEILGNKIYDLFMEYESRATREAQIVYVLDKMEANFQACRYKDIKYWAEGDNGEWYYQSVLSGATAEKDTLSRLQEPVLNYLENKCLNICRQCLIRDEIAVSAPVEPASNVTYAPISALHEFMNIVEKLALVKRDNLLSSGENETDADHTVKLMYLVMFLTPYLEQNVDYTKLLALALYHDLPEAISGEISRSSRKRYPQLKTLKKEKEQEALAHIRNTLPPPVNSQVYEIIYEYMQKQSREAKIVRMLNKLENIMQANMYQNGNITYWKNFDCGEDAYKMALKPYKSIEELREPIISKLQANLIKQTLLNMQKCKIGAQSLISAAQ